MSTKNSSTKNSAKAALLIAFLLGCFAFSTDILAVVPAPDGGYAGSNTAEGTSALFSLTSGIDNTALGFQALFRNTTGKYNSAEGFRALFNNTSGTQNTAAGLNALISNTTGNFNTADGVNTLYYNSTGSSNAAVGVQALYHNTTGFNNTATGFQALVSNTTGDHNTADGNAALPKNTTGFANTASGVGALLNNTSGTFNTALGFEAGASVTTASNVIAIGTAGANVTNSCYIGHIYGTFNTAQSAVVYIDPDGRLGTGPSARRFKKDIADMGAASELLLSMRPVTFHFKTQDTGKAGREVQQFGLIAEEVAEVNPDLILRDKEGKIYSVRYDQVNAMLLNEFLKEHRKVEQLEATVAEQRKEMETVIARLELKIQKVSAQVEMNNAAPRTIARD